VVNAVVFSTIGSASYAMIAKKMNGTTKIRTTMIVGRMNMRQHEYRAWHKAEKRMFKVYYLSWFHGVFLIGDRVWWPTLSRQKNWLN
jgi:hypothetical protein